MSDNDPVQSRLIGAILRQHRETARWTLREAASELGCDASKVSRIENGERRPVPRDVDYLLAAYGVTDRGREAVAALIRGVRSGWWSEYRGRLPDDRVDSAMLESIAGSLLVYESHAWPAFLQTDGYAAALTAVDTTLSGGDEQQLAAGLAARRAEALQDGQRSALTIIIGEAVLRQRVGGREQVLAQLRRIADDTEVLTAPFSLRVLPFTAGAHPGIGSGPFCIMRFKDVDGVGALSRGWDVSGATVLWQAELKAAVRRFGGIQDAALSPGKSLQLIHQVISSRQ